jgi:hypothetical protein
MEWKGRSETRSLSSSSELIAGAERCQDLVDRVMEVEKGVAGGVVAGVVGFEGFDG